jgi:hypothetical protein
MTMLVATLRAVLPEFNDSVAYPDTQIQFWLDQAAISLDAGRWGTLLDQGTMFWTAHQLSLGAMSQKEGETGNQPGVTRGTLSSGSVDKASFAFDSKSLTAEDAGHFNQTTYGLRFWKLAMMVGMGPVQIGTGDCNVNDPLRSYNAYPGPFYGY